MLTSFTKHIMDMANIVKTFINKWNSYKYRFLPWIALNLKNRSVRAVPHASLDKILPDAIVEQSLLEFLNALEMGQANHRFPVTKSPMYNHPFVQELKTDQESQQCYACSLKLKHAHSGSVAGHTSNLQSSLLVEQCVLKCGCAIPQKTDVSILDLMYHTLGYTIERKPSSVTGGGIGVKVTRGVIANGTVLALYPGTVYNVSEPILIQSVGNRFIFRCLDGVLIDGNDSGISRMIYRSCSQRERIGPYMTSDLTWLSDKPLNPMAIGQYINNHTKECPANVDYQEYDVPNSFPLFLRKYLPNVFYSTEHQYANNNYEDRRLLRTVVLVSLRDIQQGEELLSSYFTVVN